MEPLISVIIPVYNGEKYISKCLNSIITQTFKEWECICVDDGSNDKTSTILDEYAQKDHRIKVIHKSNEGVSIARNTALEQAKGGWIAFSDADDFYYPDGFNLLYSVAKITGAQIVLGNAEQIQVNGKAMQRYPHFKQIKMTDSFPKGSLEMWGDLFNRDIFITEKLSFHPGLAYLEDRYLMLQILSRIGKYATCPSVVYGHYKNPDSVMESKDGLRMAKHCFWAAFMMKDLAFRTQTFHEEILNDYKQTCIRGCTYFRKSKNASVFELKKVYTQHFSDSMFWFFFIKSYYYEKIRLVKKVIKSIIQ